MGSSNGKQDERFDKWRAIKGLACPKDKKQVYFPVAPESYCYLSVSRAGTKSLVFRKRMGQTIREIHLSRLADSLDETMARLAIKEAKAKAADLTGKIGRGLNPFDEVAEARKEATFRELFESYMSRHLEKSRKGSLDTRKNFENWLGDKASMNLARRKASAVTRYDAEKLHGQIAKERGEYAANRAVQLARAIYNKARQWKLFAADNPFAGISLFPEQARNRFLAPEEAGRLLNELKIAPASHCAARTLRDFLLISLFTGARKANVLAMRFDELDLAAGNWSIPGRKTKNLQGQVIPLGPTEIAILKERRELLKAAGIIGPYLFPGDGKTGHVQDIKRSWTTLRKRLEISDVTVHDLRRSLAASMASQNVNVSLIKSALNHKDLKTTLSVYAMTSKQAELEARQLAQSVWIKAAEQLPAGNAVKQLKKATK